MAEPLSDFIGMKDWDDAKQRWHGVVCRIERAADGKELVMVYDVNHAQTQVEIDDWIKKAIVTKPWESR